MFPFINPIPPCKMGFNIDFVKTATLKTALKAQLQLQVCCCLQDVGPRQFNDSYSNVLSDVGNNIYLPSESAGTFIHIGAKTKSNESAFHSNRIQLQEQQQHQAVQAHKRTKFPNARQPAQDVSGGIVRTLECLSWLSFSQEKKKTFQK